jgi:hypothetical protein
MTRLKDFPNAPAGSWVCSEGWLIVGDEAWTVAEWNGEPIHRSKYATAEERRAALRRSWRESKRRARAA